MSFKNVPVLWKVLTLVALLASVALGSTAYSAWVTSGVNNAYTALLDGNAKAAVAMARVNRNFVWYARSVNRLLLARPGDEDDGSMADIKSGQDGFAAQLDIARTAIPARAADFDGIAEHFAAVEKACAETIALGKSADPADFEAARTALFGDCAPVIRGVVPEIAKLVDDIVKETDSRADEEAAAADTAVLTNALIVLAGIVLTVLAAVFVTAGQISRPLRSLAALMTRMSGGDLDVVVDGAQRRDEVGAMSRELESFRLGLKEAETMRVRQKEAEAAATAEQKRRAELADRFASKMQELAGAFARSSGEVSESARSLSATAEETSRQAQSVSGAAEEASTNVQTVAASTEEMSASIREIAAQVEKSNGIAATAAGEAARTEVEVRALSEAAVRIGEVVDLINNIAGQTNLLALNATIEAARAGEMGKGFAVVAQEVKQLAAQTAKATEDIAGKIREIQDATSRTVGSIDRIVGTVGDIRTISTVIAAAMEQQGAATTEISSNTQLAARGTEGVSENIVGVGRAAEMTGAASTQLMTLSTSLSAQASELRTEVDAFVRDLRAA